MLTSQEVVMVLYGIEERRERLFRRRKYICGHGPEIEEVRAKRKWLRRLNRDNPRRHVARIPRWLSCHRRGGAHLDY